MSVSHSCEIAGLEFAVAEDDQVAKHLERVETRDQSSAFGSMTAKLTFPPPARMRRSNRRLLNCRACRARIPLECFRGPATHVSIFHTSVSMMSLSAACMAFSALAMPQGWPCQLRRYGNEWHLLLDVPLSGRRGSGGAFGQLDPRPSGPPPPLRKRSRRT